MLHPGVLHLDQLHLDQLHLDQLHLDLLQLDLTLGLQDAVHEQQRTAALILRGGSAGSGAEAGPGSAPDNAGQSPISFF